MPFDPTGKPSDDERSGSISIPSSARGSVPIPWVVSLVASAFGIGGGGATIIGAASTEELHAIEERVATCEADVGDLQQQRALEIAQISNLQSTVERVYAIIDRAHPRE